MINLIEQIKPKVIVVDPISNLTGVAGVKDVKELLTRIIDYLKMNCITAFFTDLAHSGVLPETTEAAISSLMDTWILLRDIELNGERNRGLYVLKSRGMKHSNQIREFLITADGIKLNDVYIGARGVLTGTSRITQAAVEKAEALIREQKILRLRRDLLRKEKTMQNRIQELQDAFASEKEEIEHAIAEAETREKVIGDDIARMSQMRGRD
jgi:circadian clock protein KaiC